MPRRNGTGPMGTGPETGRRSGYCVGYGSFGHGDPSPARQPGDAKNGYGERGFVRRNRFNSAGGPVCRTFGPRAGAVPLDKETEIAFLKADAVNLEKRLAEIKERLAKLSEEQ